MAPKNRAAAKHKTKAASPAVEEPAAAQAAVSEALGDWESIVAQQAHPTLLPVEKFGLQAVCKAFNFTHSIKTLDLSFTIPLREHCGDPCDDQKKASAVLRRILARVPNAEDIAADFNNIGGSRSTAFCKEMATFIRSRAAALRHVQLESAVQHAVGPLLRGDYPLLESADCDLASFDSLASHSTLPSLTEVSLKRGQDDGELPYTGDGKRRFKPAEGFKVKKSKLAEQHALRRLTKVGTLQRLELEGEVWDMLLDMADSDGSGDSEPAETIGEWWPALRELLLEGELEWLWDTALPELHNAIPRGLRVLQLSFIIPADAGTTLRALPEIYKDAAALLDALPAAHLGQLQLKTNQIHVCPELAALLQRHGGRVLLSGRTITHERVEGLEGLVLHHTTLQRFFASPATEQDAAQQLQAVFDHLAAQRYTDEVFTKGKELIDPDDPLKNLLLTVSLWMECGAGTTTAPFPPLPFSLPWAKRVSTTVVRMLRNLRSTNIPQCTSPLFPPGLQLPSAESAEVELRIDTPDGCFGEQAGVAVLAAKLKPQNAQAPGGVEPQTFDGPGGDLLSALTFGGVRELSSLQVELKHAGQPAVFVADSLKALQSCVLAASHVTIDTTRTAHLQPWLDFAKKQGPGGLGGVRGVRLWCDNMADDVSDYGADHTDEEESEGEDGDGDGDEWEDEDDDDDPLRRSQPKPPADPGRLAGPLAKLFAMLPNLQSVSCRSRERDAVRMALEKMGRQGVAVQKFMADEL